MSFKARDVTLKYARVLKISILALDHESAFFLLYQNLNTHRPVKLKAIDKTAFYLIHFSVSPRCVTFLNLEILFERERILKFPKRLYHFQTNTIVTRRSVTCDFRKHFCFICNRSRKNDNVN